MAVNFYDVAYDLENALRGSEEFTSLKNLYDEVNADAPFINQKPFLLKKG